MNTLTNRRGYTENVVEGQHLKLDELKEEAQGLTNKYLFKENIPEYPRPEFHVTHLRHDTDRKGLRGISWNGGFRDPGKKSPKLVWWSLSVGPDDVTAAETRLLQKTFPDRTEEQVQNQQSFLGKFATSLAFKETSRLGSYRFTFPLEEVLQAYSQQFCFGAEPVMRVFKTVFYKQEVMHVVLVHSSANHKEFSKFPLLSDDPNAICVYKDKHFIWRSEAMCGTHSYKLKLRPAEKQMDCEKLSRDLYYVWDNVAVALHMERDQTLRFDVTRLRQNLSFCKQGKPIIAEPECFDTYAEAEFHVNKLWPMYRESLRKAPSHEESDGNRYRTPPQKLIVGDFNINDVLAKNLSGTQIYCRPNAVVSDVTTMILDLLDRHPKVETIIVHVGAVDIWEQQWEVLYNDFTSLLNTLSSQNVKVIISGPLPPFRGSKKRFYKLLRLNDWLESTCAQREVNFTNNFQTFFDKNLFSRYGIRLNKEGLEQFFHLLK